MEINIFWDDLTTEKQLEILAAFGDNGNYDIIPLCTLEIFDD